MVASTQNTTSSSLISSLNAANSSLAKTATSATNGASGLQNQFMTLLTTQLQNQDPLNPMDSSQMTTQLAQISTVSGINQLNTTLQALSGSMIASSSSSMIGHGVLAAGSTIGLSNGQGLAGIQLQNAADNVVVTIKDAAGNTVRSMNLGAQQAGIVPFTWDGLSDAGTAMANGCYTFSAQAVSAGNTSAATKLAYGMVNGVTPSAAGATLNVANLGALDMAKVMMVL